MINQEVRKQQFDRFNKNALLVLTTALRASLLLLMGCGYAVDPKGERRSVHDHTGTKIIDTEVLRTETYNEGKHGKITGWLEVGEPLVYNGQVMKDKDGRTATHRHVFFGDPKWDGTDGSHEFSYE